MKVISPAGEFEIIFRESAVEDDSVIFKGEMGVWQSKIYLTPHDLWLFTKLLLKPQVLLFLLKLPFLALFRKKVNIKK